MGENKLILKVQVNKASKQKFINLPKGCDIEGGDYALVKKVLDNNK